MSCRPRLAVLAALWVGGCAALSGKEAPPAPAPAPPVIVLPPAPPPEPPPVVRPPPVRMSCIPRNFPRAPRYPDTDDALRAAPGAADRYQLMAAGRLIRQRRLVELERAVEACRRVPPERPGAK